MTITKDIEYPNQIHINVKEEGHTSNTQHRETSDFSTSNFIVLAVEEFINRSTIHEDKDYSFKLPSNVRLILKISIYITMFSIFLSSPLTFFALWLVLYFVKNLDLDFKTLDAYPTARHYTFKYDALSTERITEQLNNIVVYKDGTVTRVHKLVDGIDSENTREFLTLNYENKPLKTQFTEIEWEIANEICDVPKVSEEQVEEFIEELEAIKERQEIITEQEEYKKAQEQFKSDEAEETHVSIFDNIIYEETEKLNQKYNDLKNYVNSEYDQMKEHEEDYQEEQSDEIQESRFYGEGGVSDTQATVESNQEDDENENK